MLTSAPQNNDFARIRAGGTARHDRQVMPDSVRLHHPTQNC